MLNRSGIPKIMQYPILLSKKESSLSSHSSSSSEGEIMLDSPDRRAHEQEGENSERSRSRSRDQKNVPHIPSDRSTSKTLSPLSPPKGLQRKTTMPFTPPENFSTMPKLLLTSTSSLSQGSSLTSSSSLNSLSTPLTRPPSTKSPSRTPIPKTSVDPKEWLQWLDRNHDEMEDGDGDDEFAPNTDEGHLAWNEKGKGALFTAPKTNSKGGGGTEMNDVANLQMSPSDDTRNHSLTDGKTPHISLDPDILTEGRYYLEMCILSTAHAHLRSLCVQGLTRVAIEELEPETDDCLSDEGGVLSNTISAKSVIEIFAKEFENETDDDVERMKMITRKMCDDDECESDFHRWIASRQVQRPHLKSPLMGCRWKMQNYREGEISNNLIHSDLEIVRFREATQSDIGCTFMIDRVKKLVSVTFHIASESTNHWLSKSKNLTSKCNPISVDYVGKIDTIEIHAGVAWYLMTKRKGTGTSKMQELFDMIDLVGREMAPSGNYQLVITGFSLGGAFATIVGFYAAASDRFAHIRKVKVFAFDSPVVGSSSFVHSHRFVEKTGKLQHATFSCNDFCCLRRKPSLYDVGLQVELNKLSAIGRFCRQRAFHVRYCLFSSIPTSSRHHDFRVGIKHSKFEYLNRLQFANRYQYIIHSIDEYYSIYNILGFSPPDKKHRWIVFVISFAGYIAVVFFTVVHALFGKSENIYPSFTGNMFDSSDPTSLKSISQPSLQEGKGSPIEYKSPMSCDVENSFEEITEFSNVVYSTQHRDEPKSLRVDTGASETPPLEVKDILPEEGSIRIPVAAHDNIPFPGDLVATMDESVVSIGNENFDKLLSVPQTDLTVDSQSTDEAIDDFSGYYPHEPLAFVRNFGRAFVHDTLSGNKKPSSPTDHYFLSMNDSILYQLVKTRLYNRMWEYQVDVWDAANFFDKTRTVEVEPEESVFTCFET